MLEKLFSDTLSTLLRGWSLKNASVFEVETSFRQERTDHSMPAINVFGKYWTGIIVENFSYVNLVQREREKHRQLGH